MTLRKNHAIAAYARINVEIVLDEATESKSFTSNLILS